MIIESQENHVQEGKGGVPNIQSTCTCGSIMSTTIVYISDCLESNVSCWYQFNFTHDTGWNGCPGGTRYVKKTQYSSAPYVGVVLCNAMGYIKGSNEIKYMSKSRFPT